MGDMMSFPNTIDEFLDDYSFKDKEEVYTNGSMLIPTFRVKQGIEHHARELNNVINRQKAEIERLKQELDLSKVFHREAVAERNLYLHQMAYHKNAYKTAKSEAIKEFAERLKRTSIGLEIGDDKKFKMTIVSTVAIDNLVKEMTEGL